MFEDPTAFSLGPFSVQWYAIFIMTGALLGAHVGASRLPEDLVEGLAGRAYILVAGPSLYETAMQRAGLYVRLHQRG
jgi:prolipoprotein diacylglyceryltransferase